MSKETLTKQEIAESLCDKLSLSQAEATGFVLDVLEEMKLSLHEEGQMKISGFGRFEVLHKAQREGRNPLTGEPAVIMARKSVSFKGSSRLQQKVNDA